VDEAANLMPVKVFHEIGWAALADRWPRPGLYVAAKTGDLSANHAHRDMNAVQVQVGGEILLVGPGKGLAGEGSRGRAAPRGRSGAAAPGAAEDRVAADEAQARAHNTIVVAERDHRIDAQGRIVEALSSKRYRWVACDAGTACGENVSFVRHVVMVVEPAAGGSRSASGGSAAHEGRMVIVVDELNNGVPEKAELLWHTRGQVTLDARAKRGTITGARSKLHFALASTVPSKVSCRSERPSASPAAGRPPAGADTDRVIRLSCGALGKVLFASVFSLRPIRGKVELNVTASGVTVGVGPAVKSKAAGKSDWSVALRFKSRKRSLQLAEVRWPRP
jgi:hypothetical protein